MVVDAGHQETRITFAAYKNTYYYKGKSINKCFHANGPKLCSQLKRESGKGCTRFPCSYLGKIDNLQGYLKFS